MVLKTIPQSLIQVLKNFMKTNYSVFFLKTKVYELLYLNFKVNPPSRQTLRSHIYSPLNRQR